MTEFEKGKHFFRDLGLSVFKRYSIPRWIVFSHDLIFVFLTFLFAYLLRFNFQSVDFRLSMAIRQGLEVAAVYMVFMFIFKPYAGLIRHTTIRDTFTIILVNVSSLIFLVLITSLSRFYHFHYLTNVPLSILLIHFVLVTVYLVLVRVLIKMTFEFLTSAFSNKRNIFIFGAGSMGVTVKRVIESEISSGFRVKGFIDDDRKLQGKSVNGHTVYPQSSLTPALMKKEGVQAIVIAINNIPKPRLEEMIKVALDLDLEVFQVPTVDRWLHGQLTMRQLKKIKLEDLLGRESIKLDLDLIQEGLSDKTILVTGAAGSIGSEIVRQLMRFKTRRIIMVDQAETPVFFLRNEMEDKYADHPHRIIVGDVTHRDAMECIFDEYRPEIVFHAAAYKHVPVMEDFPQEAIRVNVGGTKIIAQLAVKYKVRKFVFISSDKAVNPTNVMGATKRICELYLQSVAQKEKLKTQFVITRFGNVLGSNGSVIPLFRKQIEAGGPVTITHPDITRFFMTIPEACQLVLEAGFMGKGGEIFIFDMGEPMKVLDLAKQMIKLSGFIPEEEIKIKYTGLRAGEKLYEELLATSETSLPTHHPKIMIARNEAVNYEVVIPHVEALLKAVYCTPIPELKHRIMEIVPEYKNGSS
jgi:FlaA1/EpsC-like NDP-sugar epimerase